MTPVHFFAKFATVLRALLPVDTESSLSALVASEAPGRAITLNPSHFAAGFGMPPAAIAMTPHFASVETFAKLR